MCTILGVAPMFPKNNNETLMCVYVCVCVCVFFFYFPEGEVQLCCIPSSWVSLMQERLSVRVLSLFLFGAYKLLRNHSHVSAAALVVCKYEGRRPSCDVCTENEREGRDLVLANSVRCCGTFVYSCYLMSFSRRTSSPLDQSFPVEQLQPCRRGD